MVEFRWGRKIEKRRERDLESVGGKMMDDERNR
jgi:hypothetical protein